MNAVTPISPYEPMNAELKAKWVEALESGRYEQGVGQLRDKDDSYCCLGVLYEVAGEQWVLADNEWCTAELPNEDPEATYGEWCHPEQSTLPAPYRKKFGLDSDAETELISLNDEHRWDFKQIANWIKEHL